MVTRAARERSVVAGSRTSLSRAVWIAAACGLSMSATGQQLLPDIVVDENRLRDNYIEVRDGRTYLRLSNGTANVGEGPLHIYGGASNGDGTQQVHQRIFDADGTFVDLLASNFVYHPGHNHIHVENWSSYRIRAVTPGGGVGEILAEGQKTSFCIIDLGVYDSSLPGYVPGGRFRTCGSTTQGLSVGWVDIYSAGLAGQEIDVTGVPAGQYWLESVVDPDDDFIELDETNNAARILVTLGGGTGGIDPDRYEPNESVTETRARPVGLVNSPNLGPAGPETVITDLTIHDSTDVDSFRFYMPATGGSGDFVRIDFTHAEGDLDLRVINDVGAFVGGTAGSGNSEQVSLSGRPKGWYTAQVYAFGGDTSPGYDLTINPSSNGTPTVTVMDPGFGDTRRRHGLEQFTVRFDAQDPEDNAMWAMVYVNTDPVFDGREHLMDTSINTPAELGAYIINSAELSWETYWVYVEVTDGGTAGGSWSGGTVTFYQPCAVDYFPEDKPDGELDVFDILRFFELFSGNDPRSDLAEPFGQADVFDIIAFFDAMAAGC